MRNYKMIIVYDGSRYKGWQRQNLTNLTIQTILERTVEQIVGYPVEIDGSGRTDAGVHANGQVANMKVSGLLDESFVGELNCLLPEDICVKEMELVPGSFHSRYSAKAKKYKYCIDTRKKPCVFTRRYTYHFTKELHLDDMKKAAEYLKGTHDFSAFTDNKDEKSKVRTIYEIKIVKKWTRLEFEFYGTGFLYHMVRILTGTLLEVGFAEKSIEDIKMALEQKERELTGFLAPARGLFLEKVYYQEGEER